MSTAHPPTEGSGAPAAEELAVPVDGGELAVLRWPAADAGAPVVLALHGITANGLSWARVAHHLAGRVTLLAPDLRGRARSAGLPGPYGVDAHVADVLAVAAASGARRPVLAGHSMGAFLTAVTAVRHPGRFGAVLLVDGGAGFPLPPDLPPDEVITAVIGPAMTRLSMTFADRAAYREFWQAHPAFAGGWTPWVEAYIQRDLTGEPPVMRSTCVVEAVRADGTGQFDAEVLSAVRRLTVPARLLWAERGLLDEAQGLYDEGRLAAAGLAGGSPVATERVPDTNHYTVLTGDAGARTVADRLLAAAGG